MLYMKQLPNSYQNAYVTSLGRWRVRLARMQSTHRCTRRFETLRAAPAQQTNMPL